MLWTCPDFKARHNLEYGKAIVPFLARFLETRPHTQEATFRKLYAKYHRTRSGCEPVMPEERERLNISIWLHDIPDKLHLPYDNRYAALRTLMEQIDDVMSFGV